MENLASQFDRLMTSRYEHKDIEGPIYERWEKSGYFNPDKLPVKSNKSKVKSFSLIMPPPNANGSLHLGHAVFVTLQDILARFWRMRGRRALWLPGADHAGFETQVVFDKKLDKEGRNRYEIPREELWKEIWNFTQENKKIMENQLRKLGASCDWSREKFTLDPDIVAKVQESFVELYNDGLIYRGERIVHWCPKHQTSLSDIESKFREQVDVFYYLQYGPFVIGTARPETKFGDKYVVMHPSDMRYKQYKDGEKIRLEWINGPITATIIKDKAVDMKFGTGVMTITPWHDAADFEIAERHGLEKEQIIDLRGRLLPIAGEFAGTKIAEARPKIIEKLREKGLVVKTDDKYAHSVRVCYKCETPIEPQIKKQWFVKMETLAKKAIDVVKKGKIKFYPENSKKVYFHWLKNIQDWNISRQIVWGIRIPAWFRKVPRETAKTWDLKLYGESTFENIVSGKKTFETRAGKPKGAEKDWRELRAGDLLRFTPVDPETERPLRPNSITRRIREILHFTSLEAMAESIPLSSISPEKNFAEYKKAMFGYPGGRERIKKHGVWAFRLAEEHEEITEVCVRKDKPHGENWEQDPDVFDTWFSSGQWPFLTLGFGDKRQGTSKKSDFDRFYPTDVMETGYDILFFWVARMIMLGLHRTGKIPFKHVYLHGLVRDKDRQKMSKSKGNVMDPLGVADIYGTDALRMALVVGNTAGNDIIISEEKIRGYRNFATKVWNITRFILMNKPAQVPANLSLTAEDRKNLKAQQKVKKEVTKHIEAFQFHLAAEKIYHYIWHTFADKIIESYKTRLKPENTPSDPRFAGSSGEASRAAAYTTLETLLEESLAMLHPFMPFVSEAMYEKIRPGKLLMIRNW